MIITCPESSCRAENDALNMCCVRCETPLQSYVKLLNRQHQLFNRGLMLAIEKKYAQARDAFAAVVEWCPNDTEARSALAMACYALDDLEQARFHWNKVLLQSKNDLTASEGLIVIGRKEQSAINLTDAKGSNIPRQKESPTTDRTAKPSKKKPKKRKLLGIQGIDIDLRKYR